MAADAADPGGELCMESQPASKSHGITNSWMTIANCRHSKRSYNGCRHSSSGSSRSRSSATGR
jgi:hypothetical protein